MLESQIYINTTIQGSDHMKLIVGLGNPGKEYNNTRHNMGFMCLDYYFNQNQISNFKEKFNGLYAEIIVKGEKIIFLKPLSYMNLSGIVIKKYMDYFNIDIKDIFIICDDLDMPLGKFKLKMKGRSGGHNGLKNIEENIGTNQYKRLKLGIGNNKNISTKDYVLAKFNNNELQVINDEMKIVNDIINDYFILKFDQLMNKYNRKKLEEENV